MMGFIARRLVLTVALFVAGGSVGFAQEAETATEKLLKEIKVDYRKIKPGVFRCVVEGKNGTSILGVEERKLPWTDKSGKEVFYIYVYCEVAAAPAGFKPSVALLTRIAEINDMMRFGSLGMSKDKDGAYTFYRNASINLKGSDAEQLADLIVLSHNERISLNKALKGYLDEGK